MCYSALIEADYRRYVRQWGADVSYPDFVDLWLRKRRDGGVAKVPRAVGLAFAGAVAPAEQAVYRAFLDASAREATEAASALAAQQARLAAAEARLASPRPTKKAAEDARIAGKRIRELEARLAALRDPAARPGDARFFPGQFVPVLVSEGGRRVVRPMRYRCRPFHVDARFDVEKPGTYNARRDALEGFWRRLFGHYHAAVLLDAFYEVVAAEDGGHRVLSFRPADGQPLLVACLWSPWEGDGEHLESFAMITGEPTPEVVAAGHDRLVQQIRPEDLDAWLNPDPARLQDLHDVLDRGPRPYYQATPEEAAA